MVQSGALSLGLPIRCVVEGGQLQVSVFILLRSAPERIGQASAYDVDQSQSHRRASYDASSAELVEEADPPPPCQQYVCSAESSSGACTIDLVALEIEVR